MAAASVNEAFARGQCLCLCQFMGIGGEYLEGFGLLLC